jgi:nucleoid-associated protein YgaU
VAVLTPRGGGASRVLQGPVEIKPIAEAKGLNLWAVDYVGATGRLTMSGVAEPQSRIFLYLDNEFLGEARADAQGNWRLTVTQDIAEGEYPMRVDLVGEDGEVLARLEVPFIYLPQGFLAVGNRVTVRPGNSLWRIARRVYGEGVQYTTIYDANKAQIVDPDIIYPGQVFYVPGER